MECHVTTQVGQFLLDVQLTGPDETAWYGLVGQSGAGKSTFLQAIAGFDPSAKVHGQWGEMRLDKTTNVILVSARTPLFPALSVNENIELVAKHNQLSEKVSSIVALCECCDLLNRLPTELSGGELQRVKLARSLLADPSVLLLDESFSAMDRALRYRILNQLKVHLQPAIKVIMVSHDVQDIVLSCDQLGVIEQGSCIASGSINQFTRGDEIAGGAFPALPLLSVLLADVIGSDKGITRLKVGNTEISVADAIEASPGSTVRVIIPAEAVTLATQQSNVMETNCLQGVVSAINEYSSTQYAVRLDCQGQCISALVDRYNPHIKALQTGATVMAFFDSQQALSR